MPDVICINPKCQRPNRDDQIYCRICGWRLPPVKMETVSTGTTANTPIAQAAVSAGISAQPHSVSATVVTRADEVSATLEQLNREHQQLISDHQELAAQHQQVIASKAQLQQDRDQSATNLAQVQQQSQALQQQKEEMEAQLRGLLSQVTELTGLLQAPSTAPPEAHQQINDLKQKLLTTENELAIALNKIQEFEASPIGQATRPLWSKLLSWLLVPIVGTVGGAVIGVHTSFNPYRPQSSSAAAASTQKPAPGTNQQEPNQDLNKAKQENQSLQQQLASQQQENTQLTQRSQDLTKKLQSSASVLTATQHLLDDAKATADKEHASAIAVQQQLEAEKAKNQQLSSHAGSAEALQKLLARHPYLNYSGPTQGTLTLDFEIHNDKPAQIVINGTNASGSPNITIKSIKGNPLPNVPVVVESLNSLVGVVSPPEPGSWQKMTLSIVGKGKRQAGLHWMVANQ